MNRNEMKSFILLKINDENVNRRIAINSFMKW
jgi:hypothetical protein